MTGKIKHYINKDKGYDVRAMLIDGFPYFGAEDIGKILNVKVELPPDDDSTLFAPMHVVLKLAYHCERDELAEWLCCVVMPKLYGAKSKQ